MGQKLVETKFPGHAFLVITHSETGRTHNHIIVSPWHGETGKKIENKKRHLYELRTINDTICKERGLSVVNGAAKDRRERMPESARKVMQYNSRSWLADLCQKADFGRAYATSYDEYMGILSAFGVTARVENKNITYFYPEQKRGKRGSKLGKVYDKAGLEEKFRANDQKFAAMPALKEQVFRAIGRQSSAKENLAALPNTTYSQGYKDYSQFTPQSRTSTGIRYPHAQDPSNSIIPIEELRRARFANILSYCRDNKIDLVNGPDGKQLLKGREFVEVHDFHWRNTRNRTQGSLIEFVAAHHYLTFLQAVAKINGNPRLLALEKHMGTVERKFTSFYVPKERQGHGEAGRTHALSLFASHGLDRRHVDNMLREGQMHVDKSGVIRIFGKDDEYGALEFVPEKDGKWQRRAVGAVQSAFFSKSQRQRSALIYSDPFVFLKHHGPGALNPANHGHDVLCLLEPNAKLVDQFLADGRNLERVTFVSGLDKNGQQVELDFFNNLRSQCRLHRIEIDQGAEVDLSRNRSIGFHGR